MASRDDEAFGSKTRDQFASKQATFARAALCGAGLTDSCETHCGEMKCRTGQGGYVATQQIPGNGLEEGRSEFGVEMNIP